MASGLSSHARVSLEEREAHRIYEPWKSAHGSSLNVANNVDSLAQEDLHGTGFKPQTSRDKALTAFAQLVALRTGAKRCMLSLFDSTNQYILAEATRDDDELWLGSAILARKDAVCEHCMFNTCTAVDEDGQTLTAKGLIIPDCRLDDRFKDRPYVISEPGVRFYAGVPIYSRNGYMIGACAVSDTKPHAGLKAAELKHMQETARSVVEHLEWARDRVDRFKGERIVRGMASFIEGCSSMREEPNIDETGTTKNTSGVAKGASSNLQPSQRPPFISRNSGRRLSHRHLDSNKRQPVAEKAEKGDSMTRMFQRAANILRQSTLADGAVIFGASASGRASHVSPASGTGAGPSQAASKEASLPKDSPGSASSDSERWETNTSDSDSSPTARPCKILSFSIADDQARADVENGSALTLGTLEKYFSLYPQGRTFSFTEHGSGVSSEDDSGSSDRETQRQTSSSTNADEADNSRRSILRKRRMDHRELLKKIPGAKAVVFIPLYDHSEERLLAGCFLWTSVTGRMMSLDADLSYLRAFGNCIISEVVRFNMQKSETAKTTFIASMSHELRSPLHGILGAAEFLADTATDAYTSGLVTSIVTCGKTLLDTLNHVLDYSKINKLGRAQMRRHAKQNKLVNLASDSSLESLSMTGEVDLGILVEEVAEAVSAGHAFKKLPIAGSVTAGQAGVATGTTPKEGTDTSSMAQGEVSLLLDVSPKRSWMVRTQPGALRRIIMNLLGNSLKYTSSGFVAVSLRAQENPNSSKIGCILRVVDSGKGMSEQFQHDRMFIPFSQEDPFQPGTGLGLSIVKSIVDSLGGTMEVKSQQGVGTEIDVHLSLTPATDHATTSPEDEICILGEKTHGQHLVLIEPDPPHNTVHHITRLEETIHETCTSWFGMQVSRSRYMDREDADIYLYSEPPPIEELLERHRRAEHGSRLRTKVPIIIVYTSAEEAISISRDQQKVLNELGSIVEVIPQPCGPRKLAKVLNICLRRAEEAKDQMNAGNEIQQEPVEAIRPATPPETPKPQLLEPPTSEAKDLVKSMSAAVSYPSPPPFDPSTPALQTKAPESQPSSTTSLHVLLVDDNKINRQLLVMFMKKHQFSYSEAENGQEALDAYKESCLPGPHSDSPGRRFDYVLMDISMPVMDGMESTRKIREFEKENGLKKSNVIALTGLASAQAQQEAETAGIDVFLPKPVKFAELKKLLAAGYKE